MQKWLRTDGWLAGGVGGVVAAPLSIVLHELGHFGAYVSIWITRPGPSLCLRQLGPFRGVGCALPRGRHGGGGSAR